MVMQWHQNGSASDYLKNRCYSEVNRLALVRITVLQWLDSNEFVPPPLPGS